MTIRPEFGSSSDWIPLRELIDRQGALSPESALLVLRESLLGLADAHEHGLSTWTTSRRTCLSTMTAAAN